jgi:hypothetical protein
MRKIARNPSKRKQAVHDEPVSDVRLALKARESDARAKRLDRIAQRARELVDVAEDMPGDPDANLRAVCAAAVCEGLDGVARSRS